MFEPDRKDWSPRLGLAYRVTPNTAIRSGYGIYYDFNQSTVQDTQDIMGQWPFGFPDITPPNLNQPTSANPLPTNVLGIGVFPPFVASSTPPANAGFAAARDNRRPYVQIWNVGIEQTSGQFLAVFRDVSRLERNPLSHHSGHQCGARHPGRETLRQALLSRNLGRLKLPVIGAIPATTPLNSRFSAGLPSGLNFLAAYTWSKSIDYQSAAHGSAQPGEGIQNGLDFRADRAVSDFDLPQNFVFSGIYELPFGEGKRFESDRSCSTGIFYPAGKLMAF